VTDIDLLDIFINTLY